MQGRWTAFTAAVFAAIVTHAASGQSEPDQPDLPAALSFNTSLALSGNLQPDTPVGEPSPRAGYDAPPSNQYAGHYYFRASLLVIESQNDGTLNDADNRIDSLISPSIDDTGEIGFDDGIGVTAAIGFHFDESPLSIEVEYAYHRIDADDYSDSANSLGADGRISLHTFAVNLLFDYPDLVGPVGLYAGGGLGFRISRFKLTSISNEDIGHETEVEVDSDGFFWQAMAGATVSVGRSTQLYGGVRWTDAGVIENDRIEVDAQMVNLEFGLRVFF